MSYIVCTLQCRQRFTVPEAPLLWGVRTHSPLLLCLWLLVECSNMSYSRRQREHVIRGLGNMTNLKQLYAACGTPCPSFGTHAAA